MSSRRGAVDLVGKKEVCENGAGDEIEFAGLGAAKAVAEDVGRKEIGCELDALECSAE